MSCGDSIGDCPNCLWQAVGNGNGFTLTNLGGSYCNNTGWTLTGMFTYQGYFPCGTTPAAPPYAVYSVAVLCCGQNSSGGLKDSLGAYLNGVDDDALILRGATTLYAITHNNNVGVVQVTDFGASIGDEITVFCWDGWYAHYGIQYCQIVITYNDSSTKTLVAPQPATDGTLPWVIYGPSSASCTPPTGYPNYCNWPGSFHNYVDPTTYWSLPAKLNDLYPSVGAAATFTIPAAH